MERLTTDRDYEVDKGAYERHLQQGNLRSIARERFLRLCEYERTGHTPEEIAEFYKMYLEKCEEVNRLTADLEKAEPYIRLAEKMNLCDLVAENQRLTNTLIFRNAELMECKEELKRLESEQQ